MNKTKTIQEKKENKSKYSKTYYQRNISRIKAREKEYRIKNREHIYFVKIKRLFGISKEDFNALWNNQNGMCSICHVEFSHEKRNWTVDHNHITGKVRGLLCDFCNKLIGFANENINTLTNAIGYIKYHNE